MSFHIHVYLNASFSLARWLKCLSSKRSVATKIGKIMIDDTIGIITNSGVTKMKKMFDWDEDEDEKIKH